MGWVIYKQNDMIKIANSRKRYMPTNKTLNPSRDYEVTRHVRTQYEEQTIQSQFATLSRYFSIFDQIREKNTPLKRETQHTSCKKNQSVHWQTEIDLPEHSKGPSQLTTNIPKKQSELHKESEHIRKRHSSHFTERNSHKLTWMQTIMRRKNNGSYGQIIKGPTNLKHESVMEKARAMTTYREGDKPRKSDAETIEKFVPLGTISSCNEQRRGRAVSVMQKSRKMLTVKKKKQQIDPVQCLLDVSENVKQKTQPSHSSLHKTLQPKYKSKDQLGFSSLIKKLSQPFKIQKHITPWEVSCPL